jgi:hypothetical protein
MSCSSRNAQSSAAGSNNSSGSSTPSDTSIDLPSMPPQPCATDPRPWQPKFDSTPLFLLSVRDPALVLSPTYTAGPRWGSTAASLSQPNSLLSVIPSSNSQDPHAPVSNTSTTHNDPVYSASAAPAAGPAANTSHTPTSNSNTSTMHDNLREVGSWTNDTPT